MNMDKNLLLATWKPNSSTYEKDHSPWSSWVHPRDAGMVKYMSINKYNPPHRLKCRNYTIISLVTEKAFDQI